MNNIPTIDEQKERGLKFLAEISPEKEPSISEAITAYKSHVRTAIYFGPIHPLNLVRWALKDNLGDRQRVLGKLAVGATLEGTVVKHFPSIREKELFMEGVEATNISYEELEPEVADFLEQYLCKSNASND